ATRTCSSLAGIVVRSRSDLFVGERTRFPLIVALSATPFHPLLPRQPRFPIPARAAYPWFHLAICALSRPQPQTSGSIPRKSFERPHTAPHAASSAASRYASRCAGQLLQWRPSFVAAQVSAPTMFCGTLKKLSGKSREPGTLFIRVVNRWRLAPSASIWRPTSALAISSGLLSSSTSVACLSVRLRQRVMESLYVPDTFRPVRSMSATAWIGESLSTRKLCCTSIYVCENSTVPSLVASYATKPMSACPLRTASITAGGLAVGLKSRGLPSCLASSRARSN